MNRPRARVIRQRRPELFLHWLRRHWVDNRSTMLVLLTGRKEGGRPRGERCTRTHEIL